jgi:Predicted Fe-S oxidoreductases
LRDTCTRKKELSTAEIFSLIDQVAALGCQRLGLWGGEPLVRDDIGPIIDRAKARGLFVTLDSNGALVSRKLRDIDNLDHLVLSLDGPRAMHDANRGEGSFDKVMKALEDASGRIPVWTITVLTKNNLGGIDFVLSAARRFGARAAFQVLHHNHLLGRNHDSLMPSNEQYREAIRAIIRKKREGEPVVTSFAALDHLLRWSDYRMSTRRQAAERRPCLAGKLYCNVDTDGTLYPCSLLIGTLSGPGYRVAGFKAAFDRLPGTVPCTACTASCFTDYNGLFHCTGPRSSNGRHPCSQQRCGHASEEHA